MYQGRTANTTPTGDRAGAVRSGLAGVDFAGSPSNPPGVPAMSPTDAYAALVADATELSVLQSCGAVLGWDQQTYMPKGGGPFRGEQLSLLAKLCHAKATDPKIGERLATAEGSDLVKDADSVEAANVREWRHGYDRATKLPSRLVEELARVTTAAQDAWVEAKGKSDFVSFRPHLEKIVALKREEASCLIRSPPGERGASDMMPSSTSTNPAAPRPSYAHCSRR